MYVYGTHIMGPIFWVYPCDTQLSGFHAVIKIIIYVQHLSVLSFNITIHLSYHHHCFKLALRGNKCQP